MKKSYKSPNLEYRNFYADILATSSGVIDYDNNQSDSIDFSVFE